jgi:PQQ-dependent catabolism-associated CXXCW motif protein
MRPDRNPAALANKRGGLARRLPPLYLLRKTMLRSLPVLCLLAGPPAAAQDSAPLFDSDGYRIADFLAPVPERCPGAETVDTRTAQRLIESEHAVPIDVLPSPPRPEGLAPGTLWLPPPHANIPGSIWLPNVGYGRLSSDLEDYFRRGVDQGRGTDLGRPLIVYCRADCWMSWNAAKRLADWGYGKVYWYPEGTTGWQDADLPLAPSSPLALP